MDIKKLIAVATGEIAHTNNGLCPDMVAGYDSRDPDCLACQIIMQAEREKQEPVFWYRPHSDGQGYDGPIHDSQIEPVRRESGAWLPLYASPAHEASSSTYTMPDGVGGAKLAGLRAQGYRAIGLVLQNDHGDTCSVTEHGRVMWDRKMAHPGSDHPEHALELVGLRGCNSQAAEAGG